MYREVIKWLKMQSIPVSKNYLRLRMRSHPDYPSLIAVADTLSELNIECTAYQTSQQELMKTGKPMLVHLNVGKGQIFSFRNLPAAQRKVKDFDKHWSGVVMLIDRWEKYGNQEHDREYKQELQTRFFSTAAIIGLLSFFTGIALWKNNVAGLLLLLFNMAGLYFSWLIVQKESGITNSVSHKICSMAKHSSCESVLFSKGAKLFTWLTWGDVGIIYFTTSLLYLFFVVNGGNLSGLQFYYTISFAALLFPFYSIYFQWKIIKQWCMLCIGVVAMLLLNSLVPVIFWNSPLLVNRSMANEGVIFFLLAVFIFFGWQLLKALYRKSHLSIVSEINATSLKRNPNIFNSLLLKQKSDFIHLPQADEAIRFGNTEAPYQLVIACNPYCRPCAKTHQAIEQLYEKYPGQISVAIRFVLQKNDDSDSRVLTVKEILKVARAKPFESVKDWYNLLNLEKFKALHHTNGEQVDAAIDKHIAWSRTAEIVATPTIFVNGRRLPELYSGLEFTDALEFEIRH